MDLSGCVSFFQVMGLDTNLRERNQTVEEANSTSNLLGFRDLCNAGIDESNEPAGEEAERESKGDFEWDSPAWCGDNLSWKPQCETRDPREQSAWEKHVETADAVGQGRRHDSPNQPADIHDC
jgi:hypothetical protein